MWINLKNYQINGKFYDLVEIAEMLKKGKWEQGIKEISKLANIPQEEAKKIAIKIKEYHTELRLQIENETAEAKRKRLQEESDRAERKRLQEQQERIIEKKAEIERLKDRGISEFYEYKVISISDLHDGSSDIESIEAELNRLGMEGWHIKCAVTNELGQNAVAAGVGGLSAGTNSTIDETILILERNLHYLEFI